MGFFAKLKNWFSGKGWTDDEIIEVQQEPVTKQYEDVEEKQYEDTEETPEVLIREDKEPTIGRATTLQVEKPKSEIEKAVDKYEKKPMMKKAEEKLDTEKVNIVQIPTIPSDLSQVRPYYDRLLTENAKLGDPEILDILVEQRGKLQHRFSIDIKVFLNGKDAGDLKVNGVLIEHSSIIHNVLRIGEKTEYLQEQLNILASQFENEFGAIGTSVSVRDQKGTITDIQVNVTFA